MDSMSSTGFSSLLVLLINRMIMVLFEVEFGSMSIFVCKQFDTIVDSISTPQPLYYLLVLQSISISNFLLPKITKTFYCVAFSNK